MTVPLTFGGTATRGTDYTITGTTVDGIAYNNLNNGTASVVFTGPNSGTTATAATITLTASADSTNESTPETVDIGFGTLAHTGLAGGADETDSLDEFSIEDGPGVTVSTSSLRLEERHASNAEKTYTVKLNTDPGATVEVSVTSDDTSAVAVDTNSATDGDQSTLTFTHGNSGNWDTAQTVTVRAENDGDVAAETVTISHTAAVSDTNNLYHGIDIDSVTAELGITATDNGNDRDNICQRFNALSSDGTACNLSNRGIKSLRSGDFNGLSNLEDLDLYSNKLSNLPANIFAGLSNLQNLDLHSNNLSSLPANIFAGLSNLQNLDLYSNNLSSLPANVFAGLSNLQELYLQGNSLICLPRIPQSVTRIDIYLSTPSCPGLVLSSSALTVPEAGRATYTVQLATEPTDAVTVMVSGMSSGVRVDTDGDRKGRQARLTFTPSNWQTEQAVTVRARADDNVISEEVTLIHTAAGGDYDSVTAELGVTVTDNGNDRDNICQRFNALSAGGTICNLSGQGIKSLSSGDFNGLSNLEDLYLDNNRLSSLPADVFAGLSNLQNLDLHSNNLSSLPANIFAGLSNLQNLDLYSNNLSSLPANVFAGLSNLQELYLQGNSLICLPRIPQSVTRIDIYLSTPSCPGLVLSSSALTVPEAGRATYTVQLATEPTDAVTVMVSGMGSGVRVDTDGDRKDRQARLTFTTSNWQTEQAVTVRARADDNATSEEVTLIHTAAGGDYDSVTAELGVTVTDDDFAPTLLVDDARVEEGPNAWLIFTLRLSRMAGEPVTVNYDTRDVTATDGEDYSGGRGTLRFGPRELEKQVRLQIHDDHHDEGEETMELVLSEALGARIDDGVGVGTILNSDPMPRAWLTRFGRTVSQHVVDALYGRFAAKPQTGLSLTVAGEELRGAQPLEENQQVLSKALGFETVTAHQLVEGSSFSFSPAADGAPAQFSIWGKGTLSSFSGTEDSVSLAGDVTTALVGADWSTERWRAGAALSHSWGSGSYGEDNNNDADISTTLIGVFPYGRYGLTPRLGIWAVAGYGWGNLSLKPDGDGTDYSPGTTMVMTAVGMDGVLLDGGAEGLSLTSTADALLVKTTSEAVDGLASSDANVTRLRLELEATRPVPLANGASLLPSLELGIRQDDGDAETGFGMELAAGLDWADPERGISAALKGRTLLTHSDEAFRDQGLAVSFAWNPSPSNRGPSFLVSHSMGAAAEGGGMDALLSPTALEALDVTPSRHHQFETKLAYGFPAFNDRLTLTPGVGLALSPDSRTYSLLWALAPYAQQSLQATPWELSLEGERQEDNDGESAAEHYLKLRFSRFF